MQYTYVLISRVRQLRIPIPISWSSRPPYAIVWSSVGEDVYDLRLPSVSRIPDIQVTVWISSIFGSFSLYFFVYVLRLASLQLSVALHHPHSPPCVFLFLVSAL